MLFHLSCFLLKKMGPIFSFINSCAIPFKLLFFGVSLFLTVFRITRNVFKNLGACPCLLSAWLRVSFSICVLVWLAGLQELISSFCLWNGLRFGACCWPWSACVSVSSPTVLVLLLDVIFLIVWRHCLISVTVFLLLALNFKISGWSFRRFVVRFFLSPIFCVRVFFFLKKKKRKGFLIFVFVVSLCFLMFELYIY